MNIEEKAEYFKALASSSRIAILLHLEATGCNVQKMADMLGLPQSTLSQHLGVLREAGIIAAKKEGYNTCYYIKDKQVIKILNML